MKKGRVINQTFTRSESDNGLTEISLLRSCATNSITGRGSKNAVEDISAKKEIEQTQHFR